MRDNYEKISESRWERWRATESRRAEHERMVGKDFWRSDWFLGVVVALAVFLLSRRTWSGAWSARPTTSACRRPPARRPGDIAVIAIDDPSIANIGRWPWSREVHARSIENLLAAQAKVIGYTVFFSEPQIDPGLPYITKLLELFGLLAPAGPGAAGGARRSADRGGAALNTDRKLAESVGAAGNVVLPMLFRLGEPPGKPDRRCPIRPSQRAAAGSRRAATDARGQRSTSRCWTRSAATAAALGHLNSPPDVDGAVRTEPLVLRLLRPVLPLAVAADRGDEPQPGRRRTSRRGSARASARPAQHPDRPRAADVHLLLQGPGRPAGVSGRLVLRRLQRQDPGGQVPRQDRADRRHRGGRRAARR